MANADIEVVNEGQPKKTNAQRIGENNNGNNSGQPISPELDWSESYDRYASTKNLSPLDQAQPTLKVISGEPSSFEKITEQNFKKSMLAAGSIIKIPLPVY